MYGTKTFCFGVSKADRSEVLPADCPVSVRVLREVVLARRAQPRSKRSVVRYLTEPIGLRISYENLYRLMDQLTTERVETLQQITMQAALNLHPEPVDEYFLCLPRRILNRSNKIS